MDMTNAEYGEYVKRKQPRSPLGKDTLKAFAAGGAICTAGEWLSHFYQGRGLGEENAATAVSLTLIFLGALLTGLGVYDDLARFAGAGTLVPITGFANAVASPALEFKTEGMVAGLAAKIFLIAGPVITFGILASVVYGVVLVLF